MESVEYFDISTNPFDTFNSWYQDAQVYEDNAEAYSLATSSADGTPNNRYLLHKGIINNKFVLYGSQFSQKAKEMDQNPQAAMAFFWSKSMKQIRIKGNIHKMPRDQVEEYFKSRSLESKVASSISKQSTPLESRKMMLDLFEKTLKRSKSYNLELPSFWEGWLLEPKQFEFFIYQEHRLNDRFQFTLNDKNEFELQRLWP